MSRKPLRKASERERTAEPAAVPNAVSEPDFRILADAGGVVTAEMSVEAWIALPNHPHQRNTARHARAVHLKQARGATGAVANQLAQVVAARLDGAYYKVDGHTRSYLWEQGQLPRPAVLRVTIYPVASRAELDALYEVFDASTAAKTRYDQVYGGFRECGFQPRSKRLRHGFLNDALNIALRGGIRGQQSRALPEVNLYRAVAVFQRELELLDSIDPEPRPFYSGVVAAALIGLALYPPERVLDFFKKLQNGEGNRKEGRSDPVDAVLNVIQQMTLEKRAAQTALQADLCARTLRGLVTWLAGPETQRNQYWLKTSIHAVPMEPLLEQIKLKKGIRDDPTL
ncbi:hypothetical protein BN873_130011 [Candidatus Competibacter denitrificans Run_A_D11]|uniref:Uncharacterized protein n=1 Tax=Candidatus Competibacter denitrificans Run_A_D11 TaxID=1400863 RepID=W6M1B8_9GAMM|nr:hypothetical protein [Candidatus Competibacter denitrificans]CDI01176.1 hypothetical protein BN873_130011 [Candidatus Competibacter denitrificans Run_A_D11]